MQSTVDVAAAALHLLDAPLLSARPARGGGNNRVYRAETTNGVFAIKFYPHQDADPRDRLGQEFAALRLMGEHGIGCVPRAIRCDTSMGCAAYGWIDGDAPGKAGIADIDVMLAFARNLAALSDNPASQGAAPASAGCFAGADVSAQFSMRLARLRAAADDAALHDFLDTRLSPGFDAMLSRARSAYSDAGLDFDQPLNRAQQTLSPSDFGLHNAIRRPDGSLVFLDFEYFGWDDPVKMIADVCWHPGAAIGDANAARFRDGMLNFFSARDGQTFHTRYAALSPLFGMIWCLIILNEFLPERWARRVAAGSTEDATEARARQLGAAKALFTKVTEQQDD